jgi:hypothetical protein
MGASILALLEQTMTHEFYIIQFGSHKYQLDFKGQGDKWGG